MADKLRHLRSSAVDDCLRTECGLRTMAPSTHIVHDPARATCPDCPRIRQERHAARMASDPHYRRFHEAVAAFAALGIRVGEHGPIRMSHTEAAKVLRLLRAAQRPKR